MQHGRGVLIDLQKHFGDERAFVGLEDLERIMREDGVVIEPGDMLFFIQAGRLCFIRWN